MANVEPFEKLTNLRDLGGIPTLDGRTIRHGLLYRSQQLVDANDADIEALRDLGLGLIIDLRDTAEHEERPNPDIPGARQLHLPILDSLYLGVTRTSKGDLSIASMLSSGDFTIDDVDEHMRGIYRDFVVSEFSRTQYARFIDEVIAAGEQGIPVLWHCTGGKDRAGFATVILLEALGVGRDAIIADYAASSERLKDFVDAFVAGFITTLPDNVPIDALKRFFLVDESYLVSAYDTAQAAFGSFESFLENGLGVTAEKRAHLQELFLE